MKILYITRGFPPNRGGSENYVWEIYRRLGEENNIEVITYYHKDREQHKGQNGIIHEVNQLGSNNKYLEFLNFFLGALKKSFFRDFDIIHAVTYPSGLCAIIPKFISGKPLVVTIHDVGTIEKDIENVSLFMKALKGFLQGTVCNAADAIIVPSEKVRKDLSRYHNTPKSKIFVTPYGFDKSVLNENVKRGLMREKWKLKDNPVVLYVGMYSPKKGLEYLIEAVSQVRREIPDIILVIAGPAIDMDYDKKIRKLVKEMNLERNVIFTGYFEERYKPNVYADADLIVEPTLYGMGYSFACIEASALGKPVIATKLLEEIGVVKNNFNGLIVPLRDSESIAESIRKILKDRKLYERLSKNGRIFVKKFDWDECAKLTEEVYEKAVKK
jgi:glycosyltransferase involved in cell wall biosynthesis